MKNIIIFFYILFFSFKICLTNPSCIEGKNNCIKCHPYTNLCLRCDKNIYSPDHNGGCENSKRCIIGNNYCLECSENEELCKICEIGYFPDENGGCSYSNNCEASYKGECLKCKDNFILIGNNDDLKICKSLFSDDFNNCEKIDIGKGLCESCKEGFYLNSEDLKCIEIENCSESTYGICQKCNSGYYLNKKENKCILKDEVFINCLQTIDGKTCDICEEGFFSDSDNNCIKSNYCEKSYKNGNCKKCISGYYLSYYDKSCINDKNCYFGMKDIGICEICKSNYYMDFTDGKCKSYEDEDFKNCRKAINGNCYECIASYFLGEDQKCSSTKNCIESYKGTCIKCSNNMHLGLDNICTYIEHCIYSSPFFGKCIECEDNYYYDMRSETCIIAKDIFKNCKNGNKELYCQECKDDFYLNRTDNLCYNNTLKGRLYKCALTDIKGEYCIRCVKDYFLSYRNNLCIVTDGCNIAYDDTRCLECNEYHCLDVKSGKCEINQYIEKEEQKIYYRCNKTNDEGTSCEICKKGFNVNKNGLCIKEEACLKKKDDDSCIECLNDENGSHCLNNIFGCVESYDENCLECNDILNLDKCTKCIEGYEIDEDGECIRIE